MRVLIIGGTGLISTATTRELVARGDAVTLLNRGGTVPSASIPDGATIVRGDRTDYATFEAHIAAMGVWDAVLDMVCFEPSEAESAVRAFRGRTTQYLCCSTVDVYTKPAASYPIREDAARDPSPAFPYAWKKGRIEETLWAAHARGDLPVTVIRPAYTYGEGRGMLHTFGGSTTYLDRIRKGKPIIVHGDGTNLWGSCHRDDVGHAFAAAAGNPATIGKAYHATGEEWLPWNTYHRLVAEAMDAPPPTLVHIPSELLAQATERAVICRENFQYNNIFDNTAARADCDFRYTVPLVTGVRRIVAWLDAHRPFDDSDADPHDDRIIAAWQRAGKEMARELVNGY